MQQAEAGPSAWRAPQLLGAGGPSHGGSAKPPTKTYVSKAALAQHNKDQRQKKEDERLQRLVEVRPRRPWMGRARAALSLSLSLLLLLLLLLLLCVSSWSAAWAPCPASGPCLPSYRPPNA